jgi:uncharacterized Zn-finger protein
MTEPSQTELSQTEPSQIGEPMTRAETQSNTISKSRVRTLSPARRAQNSIAMGLIGLSTLNVEC